MNKYIDTYTYLTFSLSLTVPPTSKFSFCTLSEHLEIFYISTLIEIDFRGFVRWTTCDMYLSSFITGETRMLAVITNEFRKLAVMTGEILMLAVITGDFAS